MPQPLILITLITLLFHSSLFSDPKRHRGESPSEKLLKQGAGQKPITLPIQKPFLEKAPNGQRIQMSQNQASQTPNPNRVGKSESAPAQCPQGIPVETFMQISSASRPQASDSGGVFFTSDLRETQQLFYLKNPMRWPEQLSFFPDGVVYYEKSPKGDRILVASHTGGDEQYDLYLLDLASRQIKPLLVDRKVRIESVRWHPKDESFLFTSNERNSVDFDLYLYNLKTHQPQLITELTGLNTISDISADGSKAALHQYRSVSDADILLFDLKALKLEPLTKADGKAYYESARFSADAKNIFFITDAKDGRNQVFRSPLKDFNLNGPVTKAVNEADMILLSEDRKSLMIRSNSDGYSNLINYEIDPTGSIRSIRPIPTISNAIVTSVGFAPTHGVHAFFYTLSDSTRTGDIWLWKPSKSQRWTQSTHANIQDDCFAREKLIKYPSFDQTEIPAFLYLPRDYTPTKPIPFVVYVHGGPESQFRPYFSRLFQYFVQRGFGVFAPNIRGSLGYGREYTALDNYKKRMDSVQDVIEGSKWLVKQGYTQSDRLAIYGGSYGGFLVLRSIQVAPDLFSAAAESVGITHFASFLKNTKGYRRKLREIEYGPLEDETFLNSISPLTFLKDIRTPLMIFHGENDPRVPVSETRQIIEELKRRDIPVEFKIFANEGHGNAQLHNIMEQARLMVHFFEKHLTRQKGKGPE